MTDQLQFSVYLPLVVDEVTVVEEIEADIFVDFDCNDEPYISSIRLENMAPGGRLSLELHAAHFPTSFKMHLWNALKGEAWLAVEDDVKEAMLEAA